MLLLAVIALGVPLALSLRARVNAEVRNQAQGQADLVAATAADLLGRVDRGELQVVARTAAQSLRGRVLAGSDGSRLWLRCVVLLPVAPIVYLMVVRAFRDQRRRVAHTVASTG